MPDLLQLWLQPLTALAVVLVVAGGVALVRRLLGKRLQRPLTRQLLCPICLGVVATWVGLLVVRVLGVAVDPILLGVLLAGSAVGIVGQLEKYWWQRRGYLLWKTGAVIAGLAGAYALASEHWLALAISGGGWLAVTLLFWLGSQAPRPVSGPAPTSHEAQLRERMKQCC